MREKIFILFVLNFILLLPQTVFARSVNPNDHIKIKYSVFNGQVLEENFLYDGDFVSQSKFLKEFGEDFRVTGDILNNLLNKNVDRLEMALDSEEMYSKERLGNFLPLYFKIVTNSDVVFKYDSKSKILYIAEKKVYVVGFGFLRSEAYFPVILVYFLLMYLFKQLFYKKVAGKIKNRLYHSYDTWMMILSVALMVYAASFEVYRVYIIYQSPLDILYCFGYIMFGIVVPVILYFVFVFDIQDFQNDNTTGYDHSKEQSHKLILILISLAFFAVLFFSFRVEVFYTLILWLIQIVFVSFSWAVAGKIKIKKAENELHM